MLRIRDELLFITKFAVLVLATAGLSTIGIAQDEERAEDSDSHVESDDPLAEVLAGHSYHGEAFNEGPRQAAYLMEGTGAVSFPVTTQSEEAQAFINQGVGQLHGFWYLEAERSFRQAAMLDPDCAIAYWGCAMANRNNEDRAKDFVEDAMERIEGVTDRERRYIEALNKFYETGRDQRKKRAEAFIKALEDIAIDYPDDLEAKAFIALQIWINRSSDVPISSYLAADALMQQIFAAEPMHPTHHFNIHLWDYRDPSRALHSAAHCGQSAPDIAHMWHMPGHIFSRLKRYEDAVWQQEASARVDHAHMIRDRVMPDEIHNFAHNNEWLIRNLIFIGRVDGAIDLAKNMIELPRHPEFNTLERRGSSRYGRERLINVLTQFRLWEEAIELCHLPYLEPTDIEREQLSRTKLLGTAYFLTGKVEQGQQIVAELETRIVEIEAGREEKVAEARQQAMASEEGESADDSSESENEAASTGTDEEEQESEEVKKAVERANKDVDDDKKDLQQVVDLLNGCFAFHEGRFSDAYEKMKASRSADAPFLNEVRFLAGERDEAIEDARKYVERHENEVIPLASLSYLLYQNDDLEGANEVFTNLRETSSSIDLECAFFTRLNPLAEQLGCGDNWVLEPTFKDDIGERVPLDTLGPFRWSPSAAPEWTLPMADGTLVSSKQFQGQPVVLIFYLGYGCLHCAEQLHAFAPRLEEFRAAGIEILAISSDDVEGLRQSIEDYEDGLPIPLVANDQLDVFKAFRAYDDFEQQPLHGTYLIDADGLIRWQDISYEPFMEHEFIFDEAIRLLGQTDESFVAVQDGDETPATAVAPALPSSNDSELPLIYATSFEEGVSAWTPTDTSAWELRETSNGNVYSQNKKRSEYTPPHRSPYNISLLNDVQVGSFQLDVDVLSTHEDYGHRDVCLFFGHQNPAQFYYVHLGKVADPHANQIFIVNEADRTKISTKTTEGTNWDDQWHHVRITRDAESGLIEVFFDDMENPVMIAEDTSFPVGQIGLGSFDDTGDWDNLQLRGELIR